MSCLTPSPPQPGISSALSTQTATRTGIALRLTCRKSASCFLLFPLPSFFKTSRKRQHDSQQHQHAMILDKPLSVCHFGEKGETKVIYSVHVHPDGSRFATGGGDHRIKVWSMDSFRSPRSAPPSAQAVVPATGASSRFSGNTAPPKSSAHVQGEEVTMLAVLPRHTGSVLCVRWSHGGRYLASASDDTYVFIWELRPPGAAGGGGSSVPFGSSDAPNIEDWARVWVLRGHGMDVLDCAW